MRLDKFLKVSRIIKRRTIAKEVCDQGRVTINGRPAKAGSEVAVGDTLEIDFGRKIVTFTVLALRENASKEQADAMFEVTGEKTVL